MAGPTDVPVRSAAVAGSFYPADPEECRSLARRYVESAPPVAEATRWIGGIVPHAGWICSGAIAGQTIATIARSAGKIDVVVVFGAIHTALPADVAALDSYARWQVPGEPSEVADELRRRLVDYSLFRVDDRFHVHEHAVEVELPLIQQAFAGAAILPVEVPPNDAAVEVGALTARAIAEARANAVFLASSDLTHYGPAYRFAPAGIGIQGLEWAKSNDRRLLDRIERMEAGQIVSEVRQRLNACGAGAIAAMMSACREWGATRAKVLRHASSYETLADVVAQRPDNAVGYASVVVGL